MQPSLRISILILLCIVGRSVSSAGQRQAPPPENSSRRPPAGSNGYVPEPMQRPLLGFAYDNEAGELRAILGIPGALVFGNPLALPAEVTNVHFAPGQRHAIVERDGAPLGLLPLPGINPGPITEIPSSIIEPSIVSFSPNGASVAIYSSSEGRLEIITGLPDSPRLLRDLTRDDLPDEVKVLALSDKGPTLLEGTVDNDVYRLRLGAVPEFVYGVTDLGGLTFAPSSDDALVFDRDGGSAFLLQNITGSVSHRLIAEQLPDLDGDIVLNFSAGQARISSTNSGHLWQIDLRNQELQDVQLPATPLMLQALRTSGKFLLSAEPSQPAWVLDTTGAAGTLYFVPAASDEEAQPQSPTESPRRKALSKPIRQGSTR
jgi:hypothetical protein